MTVNLGEDLLGPIFMACHPILSQDARSALTLKYLCGLNNAEIARAFLTSEPTIARRIVRAKRSLAAANVRFEIPEAAEHTARSASVLEVIYFVFNEGYTATAGDRSQGRHIVAKSGQLIKTALRTIWGMTPKEIVMKLYAAYATRDPKQISALLAADVVWVAPAGNATQVALGLGRSEDAGPPRGANDLGHDQIVAFMAHNFARFFGNPANEFRSMIAEGDLVFTEHRLSAKLPNGRPYVNDYCFAYEVSDGKVVKIREYMDSRGGWAQVFDDEAAGTLLDFAWTKCTDSE